MTSAGMYEQFSTGTNRAGTEPPVSSATDAAVQSQPVDDRSTAERTPADLATEELARLLSRERLLLELLLFKLVTLRQMLASGEVRFLAWASDPTLEERKRMGLLVMFYLLITAVLFGLAKRRIWRSVH